MFENINANHILKNIFFFNLKLIILYFLDYFDVLILKILF